MTVKNQTCEALVDTGASQCYMSPACAKRLGLPMLGCSERTVVLADGQRAGTSRYVQQDIRLSTQLQETIHQEINCPRCGHRHQDKGWYEKHAHLNHICHKCGHIFSTGQRSIGTPTVTKQIQFNGIRFFILDLSCDAILGMKFLYDHLITIAPRSQCLYVPTQSGNMYNIPCASSRQVNHQASQVLEICGKKAKRLIRKCGNMAYMCYIREAEDLLHKKAAAAQEQVCKPIAPTVAQKEVLQDFYKRYGTNVDQFLDSQINCQEQVVTPGKLHSIRNHLHLNDASGREPFMRMYQRTTFQWNPDGVARPQILMMNKFMVEDLDVLSKALMLPGTLYVGNTFHVAGTVKHAAHVFKLVGGAPHVAFSQVLLNGQPFGGTTFQDFTTAVNTAGQPITWLVQQLYNTKDLPEGAVPHLLACPEEQKPKLEKFFQEYQDVLPPELPKTLPPNREIGDIHDIKIYSNAQPPSKSAYKQSPAEQLLIKQQIQELLDAGLIRPSKSAYASPVLFVKKPDGSLRFCIDYRALNAITHRDKFPLPRAQDLIDRLAGAKYFTSLDLRSGQWQIKIAEEDIHKTAFITRYGQYEWLVMPFGLTNAPATFQRAMNSLFHPYLDKFVVVYLDDVLIYSKDLDTHMRHLRCIFDLLRKHKFFVKLKKYSFLKQSVTFLGHDIDQTGIHINAAKLSKVQDWPTPTSAKHLHSFLGFMQFIAGSIKNYAIMAAPLTDLLRKEAAWKWGEREQKAFQAIKNAVQKAPTLKIIDPEDPDAKFELHTDASGFAIGAVLYQRMEGKLHPVAFHSRKLNAAEKNYHTTDQEMLAIVDACRHWRHYLAGMQFIVKTDHQALQYFFSQPNLSSRQLRWLEYLVEFQPGIKILHQAGKVNVPADLLSRREDYLGAATTSDGQLMEKLLQEQQRDLTLENYRRWAAGQDPHYCYKGGWLYTSKDQLVVPPSFEQLIMEEFHDKFGHLGIQKCLARIRRQFWFPGMGKKVGHHIRHCDVCQRCKGSSQKPAGLLQPLPVPRKPWEVITMDFITDLPPTSKGHNGVYVVVDRFSKMAYFMPTTQAATAAVIGDLLFRNVVSKHGIPRNIVSDRDSRFTSNIWQELWKCFDTNLLMSTAFHPQTDGQTERTIRTVEQLLRCTILQLGDKEWDDLLPYVEMYYNATPHSSTNLSPHEVVYGTAIRTPLTGSLGSYPEATIPTVADHMGKIKKIQETTVESIKEAQRVQKKYAYLRRRPEQFQEGDQVLLDIKNLKLKGVISRKLSKKYVGPYKVLAKVGPVAYKLQVPTGMNIHPTFHVSLLKKYQGHYVQPDPIEVEDEEEEYEVETIITHKYSKGIIKYLVKWKGYDESHNQWLTQPELENAPDILREYRSRQNLVTA